MAGHPNHRRALSRSRASRPSWSRSVRPRKARVPSAFLEHECTRPYPKTRGRPRIECVRSWQIIGPLGFLWAGPERWGRLHSGSENFWATRIPLEMMRARTCRFTVTGPRLHAGGVSGAITSSCRVPWARERVLPMGAATNAKGVPWLGPRNHRRALTRSRARQRAWFETARPPKRSCRGVPETRLHPPPSKGKPLQTSNEPNLPPMLGHSHSWRARSLRMLAARSMSSRVRYT